MDWYEKKAFLFTAALAICVLSILTWTQAAYASPNAEPTKSTIADKLILQLGPDWAGVEFKLVTDVGQYPGVIVVNEAGILTLELGGSSTYTLSCLDSKKAAPEPLQEGMDAAGQIKAPIDSVEDAVQEDGERPETTGNVQPAPSGALNAAKQPSTERNATRLGIPVLHLVLYIGGAALCVGGLIVIRVLKRCREYDDEEDA